MEEAGIYLDNLPETANVILNILWNENRRMTAEELAERVNRENHTRWTCREIRRFAEYLVRMDYAKRCYLGFQVSYMALGTEW